MIISYLDKYFSNMDDDDQEYIPIIADEIVLDDNDTDIPEKLSILPLKNAVLFPGVVIPITVGRKKSIQLVKDCHKDNMLLGTVTQKDAKIEDPEFADLYSIGTVAKIIRILEMPDGTTSVIIQGIGRFVVLEPIETDPYLRCRIGSVKELLPNVDKEFEVVLSSLKDMSLQIIKLSSHIPNEASFAIKNINTPNFLVNFICSNTEAEVEEKQKLLELNSIKDRAVMLLKVLSKQVQMLEIKNEILSKARVDIDQQQRDYFLHQQMKTIQNELGGNVIEKEIEELKKKAKDKKWSEEVAELFDKEASKLIRMNPQTGEYSVQLNYLETLLSLPWNEFTEDNFDLNYGQVVLDEDHFGLEQVKERIIEHLAVLKLKGDMKSPIICLHGPPGVGKTSLGKSIAKALNRKYIRMSLGGLHDEAEIRGHRKTYIGAMPGRIIQNLKKAGSANPVFILDEIDKVGRDMHGDPESALLEVLDPEQNYAFHDNYLEVDFDLSKVMFIATANNISTISSALRDRMEMIDVSGYIVEEKIEIAQRHLLPNQLINHGLDKNRIRIDKKSIEFLITNYTRESGVRLLDKTIAKVVRSIAVKIAKDEEASDKMGIEEIRGILGAPKFINDLYEGNDIAGIVTGLAWTSVGGDILYIETSLSKGKSVLSMTGNLGTVMKESATIALEYIKAHHEDMGISFDDIEKQNVHVHVPEGAIPKDGPSAGITMVTSMVSAFTKRKVRKQIAMTGEITLRGKVLPVGGIKEKILAAKRAAIKEIILCSANKKDIDEINDLYLKGLKFTYVDTIDEVIQHALLKEKAKK